MSGSMKCVMVLLSPLPVLKVTTWTTGNTRLCQLLYIRLSSQWATLKLSYRLVTITGITWETAKALTYLGFTDKMNVAITTMLFVKGYWPKTCQIGHVRCINTLRLLGQSCKSVTFFCLWIPKRDLDTNKTPPNIKVRSEGFGAMLEYLYIEFVLFFLLVIAHGSCETHIGSTWRPYRKTHLKFIFTSPLGVMLKLELLILRGSFSKC